MRQFEIRDKRLIKVWRTLPNDITTNAGAIDFFKYYQEYEREGFLVLHTFETPAEADAARLDWLESSAAGYCVAKVVLDFSGETVRQAIDRCRQAPQPTVRVIATPDGPVDPA